MNPLLLPKHMVGYQVWFGSLLKLVAWVLLLALAEGSIYRTERKPWVRQMIQQINLYKVSRAEQPEKKVCSSFLAEWQIQESIKISL